MRNLNGVLFLLIFLSACTPKLEKRLTEQMIEAPTTRGGEQRNEILKYAIANELDIRSDTTGIFYLIQKPGTGNLYPDMDKIILAHYEGRLLDGKVFDSSYERGEPIEFTLQQVIKGWQKSIPTMKKGEKTTFFIPSDLAYGERGAGNDIPANAILAFDIELIDFYSPEEASAKMKAREEAKIKKYMTENSLTDFQKTDSGIYYKIDKPGKGDARPNRKSFVKAHYRGTLLDGTEFDSSYKRNKPLDFKLGGVIRGWQEAIPLLGKGGKGTFIIPSELAYGKRGAGAQIGPNTVLRFDIELLDF